MPVLTEEGIYQRYSQTVAEVLSDISVLVTKPEMESVGVASMLMEKVAVNVTTPEVMVVSVFTPSLLESVSVAVEGQVPHCGLFAGISADDNEKSVGSEPIPLTHHCDKS